MKWLIERYPQSLQFLHSTHFMQKWERFKQKCAILLQFKNQSYLKLSYAMLILLLKLIQVLNKLKTNLTKCRISEKNI